jgi:tetratricopeptide (TPR) repeat protein
MFIRFFNLALSAVTVVVLCGPAWCGEATQEQNLALLKQIEVDIAKKPNSILLKLQHAELMGLLRRYEEQVNEANTLLAKNPKLRDAYLIRADGEANQKFYAAALISLDRAFKLGAPTPKLLLYKARYLRNEKRYVEAIATVNSLLEVEPSNIDAYKCRSACYFRLYGPCEKALRDMEQVVLLDPSDTKAVALVSDLKRELAVKTSAGASIVK